MAEKIIGVYKITNTITGDFYIGSSKNVKHRWMSHKWPSVWKKYPSNPMYQDFQRYGLDYFVFEILEEVESEKLKEAEQQFIEKLKPTYNSNRANGFDIERYKEWFKEYQRSVKYKEYQKEYHKSDRYKETHKKASNRYYNQLCYYNSEMLTLAALVTRFRRAGIESPTKEAKKYILTNYKVK